MKTGIFIVIGFIGFLGFLISQQEPTTVRDSIVSNITETPAQIIPATGVAESPSLQLQVPDFETQVTTGETIKLSELVSDKPTMIGFWASWCHNCQRNLPIQNDIYQAYKDQVNIVEVNLSESRSQVDRYANQNNYDFHLAYDEAGTIGTNFGIQYTNTHILIAQDGTVIDAFLGDVTEEHFKQLVQ